MKIIYLSFYYPPDLSAGSFRSKSLIEQLNSVNYKELEIDLITTMPNRYHTHSPSAKKIEFDGIVKIHRINLPNHKSGLIDQSIAFIFYAISVFKIVKNKKPDLILATSSRLMTAFLGFILARRKKTKLYLDIRDIFTDTIKDVFRKKPYLKFILPFFKYQEYLIIKYAYRINLVSNGFLDYFKKIDSSDKYTNFTNGIDEVFKNFDFYKNLSEIKTILYAGNIGQGQGLDKILPQAAMLLRSKAKFKIYGDGGSKELLLKNIKKMQIDNIEVLDPINRDNLLVEYKNADILFLHLNNFDAFKKVLPSKLFEYSATCKPILAGVDGYAKYFLKENVTGAYIFDACDPISLVRQFDTIEYKNYSRKRESFCKTYARKSIMKMMSNDIIFSSQIEESL